MARRVFEKRLEYQNGVFFLFFSLVLVISGLVYHRMMTGIMDIDFIIGMLGVIAGILTVLMVSRTLFYSSSRL